TKIADFKLMEGALIEGTVTDSASNAPLAGVPLTCYGPHQPARGGGFRIVRTDKAGHYQLRVAPGKNIISVWAQVPKYLPLTKPIQVDIKQGETWQAPIQMVKGLSLVGTVVDKEGKPVANAKFKATLDYQSNHDAQWMEELEADADNMGQWTMDGLAHGKWHLSSAGEWDVISPNEVTVPLDAPLHVTVQKATLWTLKGRVITKGQQPLAGVDIKASVEIYNGYSLRSTVREVQTDAQGQFTIDKLRPTVKLSLATNMHGYNYVSGGQVTQQNAGFVAQDIVLVPLTSRITGRVVDTEGKPVPGAKVMSPDGEIDVQAVADADGKFVLSAVPASQVMVVAGYKGRIGEAHGISSNTAVNITLAPPKPPVASDVQRAYDLLEEVWADTEGMKFYREDIPIVLAADAPDLALKIARKKDGSVDDSMMSQIISNLARSNPAQAAVWAPPNLHQMQNAGAIFTASISLGLAVADINPALARDLYNRAKAYDKGHTDNAAVDQQSIIMRAVSLSKLARRIGAKDEAKQFVAKAVEVFKTIKDKNQEWILCWIAAVDYDQTSKIIDELPSEQRKSVLEEAVMRGANYDPQIARRWLDQLIALEKTDLRSGGAAGLAAQVLIPIIGKTDPAGVLEIARSIPERFYKADTLTLAAQFQPKDVALRVLHEAANAASNQPFDKVGNLARIAALAYNLDPQYGLEVFAMAREAWDSTKAERADGRGAGPNGDDGTAALAYYYSRIDPAESRLLLETEFSRWRRSLAGILDGQDRNKQIGSIATAMVAIDIERAIEMSWIIPTAGRNNGWSPPQLDAQRAIAQYLLLSDNQRHERPFNQWTNSNFFD
ncbi:MAG: carboxypeptidase regulatory-like domain-containing protein, partial [Abitibacteriaceae bacterium]|nr:carboxypeptidase regulatory-like domain-containing protein [Abditibacteriaceae bacterium]